VFTSVQRGADISVQRIAGSVYSRAACSVERIEKVDSRFRGNDNKKVRDNKTRLHLRHRPRADKSGLLRVKKGRFKNIVLRLCRE